MTRRIWLLLTCVVPFLAATLVAAQAQDVDAAFKAFWDARTPQDAARLVPRIVASGVSFDEALKRFKAGRPYSANVPKGVVRASYDVNGVEYFYALNIPASYDPARRQQVRIHLHGGVNREESGPRGDGTIGALAGAEQIYLIPYSWRDAPWWSEAQIANLRTLLDKVKRTYNVDENRVALAGFSDGGTGAFYFAMRDTTPFASFESLNGFFMVLTSVGRGDLYPNNLRNKPFFIVNGGRDPLYPTRMVDPYVEHLKSSGVDVVYRPQPNSAHNAEYWPDLKDSFEAFVRSHPRNPLPDKLSWETSGLPIDSRAGWLIIDKLAPSDGIDLRLPDLNRIGNRGLLMFENTQTSGRVDLVRTGNTVKATTRGVAEFTLLLSPDLFDLSRPVKVETNGHVAFEGMAPGSLVTLAKWAAHDNDRTMLFGAELPVKVH
jgi:acetyl esterase/lipase